MLSFQNNFKQQLALKYPRHPLIIWESYVFEPRKLNPGTTCSDDCAVFDIVNN